MNIVKTNGHKLSRPILALLVAMSSSVIASKGYASPESIDARADEKEAQAERDRRAIEYATHKAEWDAKDAARAELKVLIAKKIVTMRPI